MNTCLRYLSSRSGSSMFLKKKYCSSVKQVVVEMVCVFLYLKGSLQDLKWGLWNK